MPPGSPYRAYIGSLFCGLAILVGHMLNDWEEYYMILCSVGIVHTIVAVASGNVNGINIFLRHAITGNMLIAVEFVQTP